MHSNDHTKDNWATIEGGKHPPTLLWGNHWFNCCRRSTLGCWSGVEETSDVECLLSGSPYMCLNYFRLHRMSSLLSGYIMVAITVYVPTLMSHSTHQIVRVSVCMVSGLFAHMCNLHIEGLLPNMALFGSLPNGGTQKVSLKNGSIDGQPCFCVGLFLCFQAFTSFLLASFLPFFLCHSTPPFCHPPFSIVSPLHLLPSPPFALFLPLSPSFSPFLDPPLPHPLPTHTPIR